MYGFYWIGNLIQAILHLPLTGSIVGMLVLFITIQLGWIKMSWGEEGSTWLQSHLQLLFIPQLWALLIILIFLEPTHYYWFLV
ncbi:CidA/LrgA family protein [Paenibacillus sp. OVF10]|nr:CidA/LrgA family protein [Paenibacillus sp. OVF10]